MAAAVDSFTRRRTWRPAIWPASLVACLWLLLKFDGMEITAFETSWPRNSSAVCFSLIRIMEQIYYGWNFRA